MVTRVEYQNSCEIALYIITFLLIRLVSKNKIVPKGHKPIINVTGFFSEILKKLLNKKYLG